jgi:hypothetical protein
MYWSSTYIETKNRGRKKKKRKKKEGMAASDGA